VTSEQLHETPRCAPTLEPRGGGLSSVALIASAVSAGIGLIGVALAYNASRFGHQYGDWLYWPALLAIYLPSACVMLAHGARRRDRLVAALICGVGLYLVKVLHDPYAFTFNDELARSRTADDIFTSGHLFDVNPLNVVTSSFPGFEAMTVAIARLSGASIFHSGLVVVGAARVIAILTVFLIAERATKSARRAGLATALYAANPNFLLQGSQFSYESVGLPIAFLSMLAVTGPTRDAWGLPLVAAAVIAGGGAVVTHHASSYALALTLIVWALLTAVFRLRHRPVDLEGSWAAGSVIAVFCLAWLLGVAHDTIHYLSNDPTQGVRQLADIVGGKGGGRKPFGARGGGSHIPLAERIAGAASILLLLVGVTLGIRATLKRPRIAPLSIVLLAAAALYPVSVALRLTPSGQETAARSSEYIFVGVGVVISAGVFGARRARSRAASRWLTLAGAAALATVFTGGVVIGGSTTARSPGPYLVGGGTRSYEPESVAAARWMLSYQGPDNALVADGENSAIMGSVGRQTPQGYGGVGRGAWPIFFSPTLGADQIKLLQHDKVKYIVVDRRLETSLPTDGKYVNKAEPDRRLTFADLDKFSHVPALDRVYDSGSVAIYDSKTLLLPGGSTP
jgi:hypothetical protein